MFFVTLFVIFQAVSDLLIVCKGAVQSAENEQVKAKTLSAAKQTAETYLQLLRHLGEVLFFHKDEIGHFLKLDFNPNLNIKNSS